MESHLWRLPIGDWSRDGHGRCDDFFIRSNRTVKEAREGYFAAKKLLPNCCPERFAADYRQDITEEELDLLIQEKLVPKKTKDFYSKEMAVFVLEFIKRGDPEFTYKFEEIDMLPMYGQDRKKRHIGHLGYGLFDE